MIKSLNQINKLPFILIILFCIIIILSQINSDSLYNDYDEINNQLFLNLFNINYLLIYKTELDNINTQQLITNSVITENFLENVLMATLFLIHLTQL